MSGTFLNGVSENTVIYTSFKEVSNSKETVPIRAAADFVNMSFHVFISLVKAGQVVQIFICRYNSSWGRKGKFNAMEPTFQSFKRRSSLFLISQQEEGMKGHQLFLKYSRKLALFYSSYSALLNSTHSNTQKCSCFWSPAK